jgi:hypothetical protein
MAVNVSKTKFIIFHTKGKNVDKSLKLLYDDNEPNQNDPDLIKEIDLIHNNHLDNQLRAYKLLEVYFDKHLTFDHRTQYLLAKLNRSLYGIA